MSTKVKTAVKTAQKQVNKPVPTKKNNGKVVVNGPALKKAISDRENTPTEKPEIKVTKKFHIWDVYGVKFLMDDDMVPTRRVAMIEVTSDHDTANEPEYRNRLIQEAEQQLMNDGFYMTDVDAMEAALFTAERVIDDIRHDHEYNVTCKKCTTYNLEDFTKFLKYLRSWRERRFALADELGGCCNLPPVIPSDYQENWHIEDGNLVPNKPKPKCETTTVIKAKDISQLPKELAGAIGSALGSMIPKLPNKVEPKKIASKK